MPIRISIELNGKEIASATANNLSELADLSDYGVTITERSNPALGIAPLSKITRLRQHPRKQSVWALVEKIAAQAKQ